MGELSIKIRIADRDYPMRVDEKEEERLRIAGKLIAERLTGEVAESFSNAAMQWGTATEPEALEISLRV